MNARIAPTVSTSLRPGARLSYRRSPPMALIGSKLLKFKPPAAGSIADIAGYRLRFAKDAGPGTASNYALAPVDLGKPPLDAQGFVSVDLALLPATSSLDGTYDFSVTAYDDATPKPNESEFLPIENANVDFVAPAAPTDGSVS